MRTSMKGIVGLAIILCLVAAQGAVAGITAIEGPYDINGTIVSGRACQGTADGITVLTDTGEETVYGLGPAGYWAALGVEFPEVGEYVEIEAYEVSFSDGTSKLIACSVTLADGAVTVQLRDEDFSPLWKKK